ncbi:hypothetical protein CK215_15730 [Mesorhizobium sp. WSM3864]|nr:hypothetical protein CK215_15730 [Mesorhizobium sp. WSM3864]
MGEHRRPDHILAVEIDAGPNADGSHATTTSSHTHASPDKPKHQILPLQQAGLLGFIQSQDSKQLPHFDIGGHIAHGEGHALMRVLHVNLWSIQLRASRSDMELAF